MWCFDYILTWWTAYHLLHTPGSFWQNQIHTFSLTFPVTFQKYLLWNFSKISWHDLLLKFYLKATKLLHCKKYSQETLGLFSSNTESIENCWNDHYDRKQPFSFTQISELINVCLPPLISPLTKWAKTELVNHLSLYTDDLKVIASEASNHFLVTWSQKKS